MVSVPVRRDNPRALARGLSTGPSLKNCMFAVLLPIIFEVGR